MLPKLVPLSLWFGLLEWLVLPAIASGPPRSLTERWPNSNWPITSPIWRVMLHASSTATTGASYQATGTSATLPASVALVGALLSALLALSIWLLASGRRRAEALASAEQAVALRPDCAEAHAARGAAGRPAVCGASRGD